MEANQDWHYSWHECLHRELLHKKYTDKYKKIQKYSEFSNLLSNNVLLI